MSTRTVFHIRDRVAVQGRYVGRIGYFLSNGRILVVDDAGTSRAYYPDQLQLVRGDTCPEESTPVCPTPAKLTEAVEIVEAMLNSGTKKGARMVRLHALLTSALDDFFLDGSDTATTLPDDEEVGELVNDPPF